MHISKNRASKIIFDRINPSAWPFSTKELPKNSALVGGAIRDAFLGRLSKKPDFDLIIPEGTIRLVEKIARKISGKFIILDYERESVRLISNNFTFDL